MYPLRLSGWLRQNPRRKDGEGGFVYHYLHGAFAGSRFSVLLDKWRNIHIIKTEERTLNMTDHEQIEERYLVKKVSFLFDRKFSILRKKGVKK